MLPARRGKAKPRPTNVSGADSAESGKARRKNKAERTFAYVSIYSTQQSQTTAIFVPKEEK